MSPQQYKRATEIYDRLTALAETKKSIEGATNHRIYFAYKCIDEYKCCPDWAMRTIADLLDKHDKMIRQEIDEEIERLNKEILML